MGDSCSELKIKSSPNTVLRDEVWGRLKVLVPSSGLFSRSVFTLDGLEVSFVTVHI
jgi:hypothetical protein